MRSLAAAGWCDSDLDHEIFSTDQYQCWEDCEALGFNVVAIDFEPSYEIEPQGYPCYCQDDCRCMNEADPDTVLLLDTDKELPDTCSYSYSYNDDDGGEFLIGTCLEDCYNKLISGDPSACWDDPTGGAACASDCDGWYDKCPSSFCFVISTNDLIDAPPPPTHNTSINVPCCHRQAFKIGGTMESVPKEARNFLTIATPASQPWLEAMRISIRVLMTASSAAMLKFKTRKRRIYLLIVRKCCCSKFPTTKLTCIEFIPAFSLAGLQLLLFIIVTQ